MRSSFSGIEISKRALFSQQTALQTTSHNIANANTAGYSRQVVNLTASNPLEAVGLMRSTIPGQIGMGVEFDSIRRIRDTFLDQQFYNENKDLGSWTVRQATLEKLEAITNEPSDGGNAKVIEGFWNAWQVLSNEPESATARAALKESALAMTDSFNHTAKQLDELKNSLTHNLDVKAQEANTILEQVARLNNEIFRVEGLGNDANDLRDKRDLLVDGLSKIINIAVDETASGYNIRMGSFQLVNGINVETSFETINPSDVEGSKINFEQSMESGDLISGETHGMIVSRDTYLAAYQYQLDSMINAMVQGNVEVTLPKGSILPPSLPAGTIIGNTTYTGTEVLSDAQRILTADTKITVKGVNGLHGLGYTLESPAKSGIPFFTSSNPEQTNFNAANIRVNIDIVNKPMNITSSLRVATTETNGVITIDRDANNNEIVVKGNNTINLLAAGLKNTRINFDPEATGIPLLSNGTFNDYYQAIVGQLGLQAQEANRQSQNQKILVDQVDGRRQSVSGVSMDEEVSNMIKFQHAYNAAARSMTTFDQMLDKIINSMGIVGR
ncbi:flagellar hook-associated protein FlgK [Paenibacillus eucommiae]|uniref:Flagellar hook-associated protein 1 n=1 Tax=Paenibacillus eucommiae TaxID=1355755 RepID=A0ABS4IYK6_9BACL|nr:flagellar hook-associated protein FlgK [Paenibacillus eucommiae]MBP1992640.1 flagellar hook-associated protein 1 FlgK [Paenibacillus eucommiae]